MAAATTQCRCAFFAVVFRRNIRRREGSEWRKTARASFRFSFFMLLQQTLDAQWVACGKVDAHRPLNFRFSSLLSSSQRIAHATKPSPTCSSTVKKKASSRRCTHKHTHKHTSVVMSRYVPDVYSCWVNGTLSNTTDLFSCEEDKNATQYCFIQKYFHCFDCYSVPCFYNCTTWSCSPVSDSVRLESVLWPILLSLLALFLFLK